MFCFIRFSLARNLIAESVHLPGLLLGLAAFIPSHPDIPRLYHEFSASFLQYFHQCPGWGCLQHRDDPHMRLFSHSGKHTHDHISSARSFPRLQLKSIGNLQHPKIYAVQNFGAKTSEPRVICPIFSIFDSHYLINEFKNEFKTETNPDP